MSTPSPDARPEPVAIDVVRGTPTEEELAALIAVVTESYAQESAAATVEDEPPRSGWELSRRAMREPLRRDLGWGRYGG